MTFCLLRGSEPRVLACRGPGAAGADKMAEEEGFEPPEPFRVQRFSRPPVSTTHPFLRHYLSSILSPDDIAGSAVSCHRAARSAHACAAATLTCRDGIGAA